MSIPQHDWMLHLFAVYPDLLWQADVTPKAETWDCENYTAFVNALATVQVWKAGYLDTRCTIGWLRVNAKTSWAGLPPMMHALMFAVTDRGLYIIEPQNGQSVKLDDYPNKYYIQEVYLF